MSGYNPDHDVRVPPCRCPRGTHRCIQRITQEDLRCDTCRKGCSTMVIRDTAGNDYTVDHALTDFQIKRAP